MEVLQQLEPLMREIIAPQAAQIDEQARYPRAALDALAAAGLLGLISASEVGGRGKGLAEAVQVIERIAQDCPCTAMVLTMHYCGVAPVEPLSQVAAHPRIGQGLDQCPAPGAPGTPHGRAGAARGKWPVHLHPPDPALAPHAPPP